MKMKQLAVPYSIEKSVSEVAVVYQEQRQRCKEHRWTCAALRILHLTSDHMSILLE
jgi:hypothetical protein